MIKENNKKFKHFKQIKKDLYKEHQKMLRNILIQKCKHINKK